MVLQGLRTACWVMYGIGVCLSTAGAAIDLKEVHARHDSVPPAHQNWITPLLLGLFHGLVITHKLESGYTNVYLPNKESKGKCVAGLDAFATSFVAYTGMLVWFASAGWAMHFDD